jgi:hypothetical protein
MEITGFRHLCPSSRHILVPVLANTFFLHIPVGNCLCFEVKLDNDSLFNTYNVEYNFQEDDNFSLYSLLLLLSVQYAYIYYSLVTTLKIYFHRKLDLGM